MEKEKEVVDPETQEKIPVPPHSYENLEVKVWARPSRIWRLGRKQFYLNVRDLVEFNFRVEGSATDVLSVEKHVENILFAQRIIVQVDTTHPDNNSGDIDINVLGSLDGKTFSTVPWAKEEHIGDGVVKIFSVSPGPYYFTLTIDNNAAATVAVVKVLVLILD